MPLVIAFLEFFWRQIPAARAEPLLIVPGHPLQGCQSDIAHSSPRPFRVDELLLVQATDRFRRGVTVRITLAPGRADSFY